MKIKVTVSQSSGSHFFPPSPINAENELPNSPTDNSSATNQNSESHAQNSNKFDFNRDEPKLVVDFQHEDCDTTTESLDVNQKQNDSFQCDESEELEASGNTNSNNNNNNNKSADMPFLASESANAKCERNTSDLAIVNETASCSNSKNSSQSFNANTSSIIEEDENSDSMLISADTKTSPYSYVPKYSYENVSD